MPQPAQNKPLRYRDFGVSIDAGNSLAARIKPIAQRTHNPAVLGGIGGFGALYELPQRFANPVLVAATDGVGTKLNLAQQLARHDTVGIDLVAMCVNDLIVQGAQPLFFLDYFATSKLRVGHAETIVDGIARGCEIAGCALVGGESAEMPGMYAAEDYDLAGFCVGVVERENILDRSRVQAGDAILGLASSGPHSNGFSLIRGIVERSGVALDAPFANTTLGETLLTPTRIYVKAVLALLAEVRVNALAHITGGGLRENPPRVLPAGVVAEIAYDAWQKPEIFAWLQHNGNLELDEMLRVFNCGIGMVVVVPAAEATRAQRVLESYGERVFRIGQIRAAPDSQQPARVEFV